MPSEGDLKKRVGRKLTKRKKEGHQVTMEIPERFRDGDDADEDITALPGATAYMNQSVFGMIAAAGSQVDFNARFDAQSSDEEDGDDAPDTSTSVPSSSSLQVEKTRRDKPLPKPEKHKRKFSESKLMRSFSRMGSSSSKPKSKSPASNENLASLSSSNEGQTPEVQIPHAVLRDQSGMSRMLEAKAELSLRPSFDVPRDSRDNLGIMSGISEQTSSLANRLMEIFNFEKAEDVIEGNGVGFWGDLF